MSTTKGVIKKLKPGKLCVIDGEPCKVTGISTSVAGKHGGAKARLEAVGIFDGKKRSVVAPASNEIDVPIVDKRTGQVVAITGDNVQVMDLESYETFDVKIPEDMKDDVTQGCEIAYWIIMGRKMVVSIK